MLTQGGQFLMSPDIRIEKARGGSAYNAEPPFVILAIEGKWNIAVIHLSWRSRYPF